tara:strand:+ start:985 stop:1419 length:435 start_codon:yes stop_codon:yes gene_type:complete
MSKIKSFRGNLADGGQDRIYLSGDEPADGYRIAKFQAMPDQPGLAVGEHTLQIFKAEQASASNTVDFNEDDLIGVVSLSTHSGNLLYNEVIIFDNEVFNQDIYITHVDNAASAGCNYYIELEQIKLSNGEQAVINFKAALLHGR